MKALFFHQHPIANVISPKSLDFIQQIRQCSLCISVYLVLYIQTPNLVSKFFPQQRYRGTINTSTQPYLFLVFIYSMSYTSKPCQCQMNQPLRLQYRVNFFLIVDFDPLYCPFFSIYPTVKFLPSKI